MATPNLPMPNPLLGINPEYLARLAAMGFPQAQPAMTGNALPVATPQAGTAPGVPRVAPSAAQAQAQPEATMPVVPPEQDTAQGQGALDKIYRFLLRDPRSAAMMLSMAQRMVQPVQGESQFGRIAAGLRSGVESLAAMRLLQEQRERETWKQRLAERELGLKERATEAEIKQGERAGAVAERRVGVEEKLAGMKPEELAIERNYRSETIRLKEQELQQDHQRMVQAQQAAQQNEALRQEAAKAQAEYQKKRLELEIERVRMAAATQAARLAQLRQNEPLMRALQQATDSAVTLLSGAFNARELLDNPELADAMIQGSRNLMEAVTRRTDPQGGLAGGAGRPAPHDGDPAAIGREIKQQYPGIYDNIPDAELGQRYLHKQGR